MSELKECKIHGLVKFASYKNGSQPIRSRCTKCQKERAMKAVQKNKDKAIELFGSKCSLCGYDKCKQALEWHHLDPKEKELNPSQAFHRSWDRVLEELNKCILVCANCHRELHYPG